MFKLSVRWVDLRGPWQSQAGRWVSGSSWIEPYPHAALACTVDTKIAGVLRMKMTEVGPGPCDFMVLSVSADSIEVTSGPFGTAPVYLIAHQDGVTGSWSVSDLAPLVIPRSLCGRAVARVLSRQWRYGPETVFTDVLRVTAGVEVKMYPRRTHDIRWPEPVERVVKPRRLRADVDPVTALDHLLRRVAARVEVPTGTPAAIELSGGLDSANVALTVARDYVTACSYGLLVPGLIGKAQGERRSAIVEHFRLSDTPVNAADFVPFHPNGPRGFRLATHQPEGDSYLEAFAAGYRAIAARGAQVVFTGFGGDEAFALPSGGRRTAPVEECTWLGQNAQSFIEDIDTNTSLPTTVPLPSLLAFQARNPGFLSAGLWPVAPLADPLILRFGDSLPTAFRKGKLLLRDRLIAVGLSPKVANGAGKETFAPLWRQAMTKYGLPKLRSYLDDGMILLDTGYVNADRLHQALTDSESGDRIPTLLYDTLSLETALRSFSK